MVVPSHNYDRYLRQAVGSALDQEGVDVEVIVVDDASSDGSLSTAHELAEQDPRVRVLANERNLGPVATFNKGLDAATGEFLVRLDADDLLTPGSTARAVAVMQNLPGVGLVYGHPLHFAGADLPRARVAAESWLVWKGVDWLASRCRDGTNVITSPEAVMRRSVVERVGGQKDLAHTHDMEMWLRMAAHTDVAYVQGSDQAWHREHPGSLSTQAADPLVILAELRDAFDTLFSGRELVGVDQEGLHRAARRAVAGQALTRASSLADRGSAPDEIRPLLEFAVECSADVVASRECARLTRLVDSPGHPLQVYARLAPGAWSRLSRRLQVRSRERRWNRSGVYEPLHLTEHGRRGVEH